MKIFIKRTIICLLCMLSVVSFTACEAALQQIGDMLIAMQSSGSEGESSQDSSSPQNGNSSINGESSQNGNSSQDSSSPQDSDITSTPVDDTPVMSSSAYVDYIFTVDMQFPVTSKSSMALVELIQVYEDFFTPIGSDEKFIIAEYRVVKDYYHHFSENTVINVPFKVFHTDEETTPPNIIYGESSDCASDVEVKQMDPTIFSSFLQRYQKVVLYTTFLNESDTWCRNANNRDRVSFENVTDRKYANADFILIGENDLVCIDDIYQLLDENNCSGDYDRTWDYPDFAYSGMSLEQLEINIEKLYRRLTNT